MVVLLVLPRTLAFLCRLHDRSSFSPGGFLRCLLQLQLLAGSLSSSLHRLSLLALDPAHLSGLFSGLLRRFVLRRLVLALSGRLCDPGLLRSFSLLLGILGRYKRVRGVDVAEVGYILPLAGPETVAATWPPFTASFFGCGPPSLASTCR